MSSAGKWLPSIRKSGSNVLPRAWPKEFCTAHTVRAQHAYLLDDLIDLVDMGSQNLQQGFWRKKGLAHAWRVLGMDCCKRCIRW
jgi:hypothetical protein